eukprot:1143581-Pelagomonas_calceolata.AAC.2
MMLVLVPKVGNCAPGLLLNFVGRGEQHILLPMVDLGGHDRHPCWSCQGLHGAFCHHQSWPWMTPMLADANSNELSQLPSSAGLHSAGNLTKRGACGSTTSTYKFHQTHMFIAAQSENISSYIGHAWEKLCQCACKLVEAPVREASTTATPVRTARPVCQMQKRAMSWALDQLLHRWRCTALTTTSLF